MTVRGTQGEADRVFRALSEQIAAGRPAVLATIVDTRGSTPRKAGARMLVGPEGILAGTVGGGCGEGEVLEAAREVMMDGVPRMVQVDLTEDLVSLSPAVCGGLLDIWVERVEG